MPPYQGHLITNIESMDSYIFQYAKVILIYWTCSRNSYDILVVFEGSMEAYPLLFSYFATDFDKVLQ